MNAMTLTPRQLEALADKVAAKVKDAMDEMWPLERLHQEKGWSKSFIYKNWDILGGVKAGGKLFFSRNNIEALIRSGRLINTKTTKIKEV